MNGPVDSGLRELLRNRHNKRRMLRAIDAALAAQEAAEARASAVEAEAALEAEQRTKLDREAEKAKCADDIVHWFNTWVWCYDPRLAGAKGSDGKRLAPYTRFVLWPKQVEFLHFLAERVDSAEEWLLEKSRDTGATYLCAGFALHRWLFVDGFKTTFGSRKAEYVDKSGQPDSIFEKLRIMLRRLPEWMLPEGFRFDAHCLFMRLQNPATGATITGEGGEDMGRGGRSSLYVVDEAAFVPNAEATEKALSGNTDCPGWVSTVNGMGNLFARKRHGGSLKPSQIFRLHWRDDPRKDEAWAEKKRASLTDPTAWPSEYDIDYAASLEGVCIPASWVQAAQQLAALDPDIVPANAGISGGDVGGGKAKSVLIHRFGPVVLTPESRGDPDTTDTAYWMLDRCLAAGSSLLNFDAPGIGAGVASTLAKASDKYDSLTRSPINTGLPPSHRIWEDGRSSEEMFGNLKAEVWWLARAGFARTFEHVKFLRGEEGGRRHPPSDLFALPADASLASQLSLVRWFRNEKGKIVIETKAQLQKRGIPSPDYADAFVLTLIEAPDDPTAGLQLDAGAFHRANPWAIG